MAHKGTFEKRAPVLGKEHNTSGNLEVLQGIRRLWNFFEKHDIFQGHDRKNSGHLPQ